MNIDLLFTRQGEAGLLCDNLDLEKVYIVKYDYQANTLILDYGFNKTVPLNIPVEYFCVPYLLRLTEIHIGIVQFETIQSIRRVGFSLINCVVITEPQRPRSRMNNAAFEIFMRQCTSGQAVHRSDLGDDTKTAGVLMGANPAVLKYAPHLTYQNGRQYAPAGPAPASPAIELAPSPNGNITTTKNPLAPFVKGYKPPEPTPLQPKNLSETEMQTLLEPLMKMVGLIPVKKAVRDIANLGQLQATRQGVGLINNSISMHMIFSGPPGTGKTRIARELGRILADLGFLEKGHVIEVDRSKLVGQHYGETAKIVAEKFESARGGILFIDEAYTLTETTFGPDFGAEAIATLLKLMEDNRSRTIVIAAGYSKEMHKFLESNPGLKSRFTNIIEFPHYSTNELTEIFKKMCEEGGYVIDEDAIDKVKSHVAKLTTSAQINAFGNARGIRNIYERAILAQAGRIVRQKLKKRNDLQHLISDDIIFEDREGVSITDTELDDLLRPLNELIGLSEVKKEIADLAHYLHVKLIRKQRGLPVGTLSLHSIFSGPPGTGKTTVARLFGKILHRLGFLEKGHVVEVDRSKLVGQYHGETAKIVADIFTEAQGGILFIDEAYTLIEVTNGANFGREALSTLLKLMEDHRDKVLVICAGYEEEIKKFLESNPGLKSRFPQQLHFKSYTPDELITIFKSLCVTEQYVPTSFALNKIKNYVKNLDPHSLDELGNARLMRNIFEKTIRHQSRRISKNLHNNPDILILEEEDIFLPEASQARKVGFI